MEGMETAEAALEPAVETAVGVGMATEAEEGMETAVGVEMATEAGERMETAAEGMGTEGVETAEAALEAEGMGTEAEAALEAEGVKAEAEGRPH